MDTNYPDPKDRTAAYTLVYMSICITCVVWQIISALLLVRRSRKLLHFAVLAEVLLAFFVILCSLLNPLAGLSCDFRYWVSIIAVNLGGCCIQSILLYKAYICYDNAKWLLWAGSVINCGYLALIFLYATLGKVPSYRDEMGNCLMQNFEWPAIAKLGLDILSNAFLSVAFLMVIYRHYRLFGNNLHKSLLSSGSIFSVGVIASNIVTGILIACKAMGGLSADLYSFDCEGLDLKDHTLSSFFLLTLLLGVITGYLLIKQFKQDKGHSISSDTASKTIQSDTGSAVSHNSRDDQVRVLHGLDMPVPLRCRNCTSIIYPDLENIIHTGETSKH